jgi:hypothetical protein
MRLRTWASVAVGVTLITAVPGTAFCAGRTANLAALRTALLLDLKAIATPGGHPGVPLGPARLVAPRIPSGDGGVSEAPAEAMIPLPAVDPPIAPCICPTWGSIARHGYAGLSVFGRF